MKGRGNAQWKTFSICWVNSMSLYTHKLKWLIKRANTKFQDEGLSYSPRVWLNSISLPIESNLGFLCYLIWIPLRQPANYNGVCNKECNRWQTTASAKNIRLRLMSLHHQVFVCFSHLNAFPLYGTALNVTTKLDEMGTIQSHSRASTSSVLLKSCVLHNLAQHLILML